MMIVFDLSGFLEEFVGYVEMGKVRGSRLVKLGVWWLVRN